MAEAREEQFVDPEDVPAEFDRSSFMSYVRLSKEKGALIGVAFLVITTVIMAIILSQTSHASGSSSSDSKVNATAAALLDF
eukprot:ANDGO_05620.mRNA.1 hypothetical protein